MSQTVQLFARTINVPSDNNYNNNVNLCNDPTFTLSEWVPDITWTITSPGATFSGNGQIYYPNAPIVEYTWYMVLFEWVNNADAVMTVKIAGSDPQTISGPSQNIAMYFNSKNLDSDNSNWITFLNQSGDGEINNIFIFAGSSASAWSKLDLYENDPIKMTFSLEDIDDLGSNTTAFSRSFRLPHTPVNGKFFQDVCNVNGTFFNSTQIVSAYINVNGTFFIGGHLHLNSVYNNYRKNTTEYETVFLGTTSALSGAIGDKKLIDLDLSAYDHQISYLGPTGVSASWAANGYLTGGTAGIFNGDILYPLVEWGYTYDDNSRPIESTMAVPPATGSTSNAFTQVTHPLDIQQMKPAIRAKAIWDQIFLEARYNYNSEFLDSPRFRNLYCLSDSQGRSFMRLRNDFEVSLLGTPDPGPSSVVPTAGVNILKNFGAIISDQGRNLNVSDSYFLVPVSGDYTFNLNTGTSFALLNQANGATFNATFYLVDESNTTIDSTTVSVPGTYRPGGGVTYLVPLSSVSLNWTTTQTLTQGTKVYVKYSVPSGTQITNFYVTGGGQGGGVQINTNIQVNRMNWSCVAATASTVIHMQDLLPSDTKQIDFIKSLITKFKLKVIPSKTQTNNFTIEPYNVWITQGGPYDWTHKLDESKDFIVSPLFLKYDREIVFTDLEDTDYPNFNYQNSFKKAFGEHKEDSQIRLIKDTTKIDTIFSPIPLSPIGGATSSIQWLIPHLASIKVGDNQGDTAQILPIQPNIRLAYYNGLQPTAYGATYSFGSTGSTAGLSRWFIVDEPSAGPTYYRYDYPLISAFEQWPIGSDTMTLDWQGMPPVYLDDASHFPIPYYTPTSVYTEYWERWYEATLGEFANEGKLATGYFRLTDDDIYRHLDFNDRIFVKDAWWYILKIYDYTLGEVNVCKVDLLKAVNIGTYYNSPESNLDCIDVTIPDSNFDDPGLWTIINNGTGGNPGATASISGGSLNITTGGTGGTGNAYTEFKFGIIPDWGGLTAGYTNAIMTYTIETGTWQSTNTGIYFSDSLGSVAVLLISNATPNTTYTGTYALPDGTPSFPWYILITSGGNSEKNLQLLSAEFVISQCI